MSDNGAKTPAIEPVVLNPENGPLVAAMLAVANALPEAAQTVADGIRDLARVVAINATERVPREIQDKASGFVEAFGRGVLGAAQRIKEA